MKFSPNTAPCPKGCARLGPHEACFGTRPSSRPEWRARDPRGITIGKQATKTDLVDIARALGLSVTDRFTVPELRAVLRARLDLLWAEGKIPGRP